MFLIFLILLIALPFPFKLYFVDSYTYLLMLEKTILAVSVSQNIVYLGIKVLCSVVGQNSKSGLVLRGK